MLVNFNAVVFATLCVGLFTSIKAQAQAPAADAITINSPASIIQCQPIALTWNNAQPNGQVYVSAVNGRDIGSEPIIQFTPQPSGAGGTGSFTWPSVNLTAGTSFTLVVSDSRGQPNYSSMVTVNAPSSGTTCTTVNGGEGSPSTSTASPTSSAPVTGAKSSTPSTGTTSVHTGQSNPTNITATHNTSSSGSSSSAIRSVNIFSQSSTLAPAMALFAAALFVA